MTRLFTVLLVLVLTLTPVASSASQRAAAADEGERLLFVSPGRHQDGLVPHCTNDSRARNKNGSAGLHIPPSYLDDDENEITVPMEAGDILLMTRRTLHGSHSNTSDHVRWSFDLRYNPVGQPTGRSAFPGLVARSHTDPSSELHDPEAWTNRCRDARARLAEQDSPRFNRWDPNSVACT